MIASRKQSPTMISFARYTRPMPDETQEQPTECAGCVRCLGTIGIVEPDWGLAALSIACTACCDVEPQGPLCDKSFKRDVVRDM